MELTKAEKARLGAFVLVGTVLFLGAVLTLAGLKAWERRDTYTVHFKDAVSGLERNAQVKYQGLRVGRVEDMRIAEDDPTAIEVELSLEHGTHLHEGTTAVLDLSGITGLKTINLTPGDPKKPHIKPGSRLPAGQSLIDKISGQAEVIGQKMEQIANNLARWTGDENRERFEALLEGSSRLALDLDIFLVETRQPLVTTLEEAAKTSAALTVAATEGALLIRDVRGEAAETLKAARLAIAEGERLLKAADQESVRRTVKSAASVMARLDARLSDEELGETMTNLKTALVTLNKLIGEMDIAVRASRDDFVTSLSQLRQATEDLREFSRIIAQDPSSLIRGKEASE